MQNINGTGDDTRKKDELNALEKELEMRMRSVHDDLDVDKINEILDKIEKLEPLRITLSNEERFREFQNTHFLKALEDKQDFEKFKKKSNSQFNIKNGSRLFNIPRVGFIVILITTIMSITSVVVLASFGVLDPIIEWTKETFNRSGVTTKEEKRTIVYDDIKYEDYDSIKTAFGIPILEPMDLINNYELILFDYIDNESGTQFFLRYKDNDIVISYDFTIYTQKETSFEHKIEINQDDAELYTKNNIDFYILKNENWYLVTWDYFGVTYTSSGFDTKEEVLKLIESL